MPKLELKYIAPYLPYGLPIRILNHKCDYVGIELSKVNGYYYIGDSLHVTYEGGSTGKDQSVFKPILRPMSDLLKENFIESFNDFQFEKEEDNWVFEALQNGHHFIYADFQNITYRGIEWLLENFFDVFGLIDQGLAIDINTLES